MGMFDFLPDEQRSRVLDYLAARHGTPDDLGRPPEQGLEAAPAPAAPAESAAAPPARAAPADDTMERYRAAQDADRATRRAVATGEWIGGFLGNKMDPAKLNVNAAGDVANEVGLKHKIAGEDREAQMFGPKLRQANATAATEEAGVPFAGVNAKNKADELAARAAKEGQSAASGAADLQDKQTFRDALRNGDSTATATVRGLAAKLFPTMKDQFANAQGAELYPLLGVLEKTYGIDATAEWRKAMVAQRAAAAESGAAAKGAAAGAKADKDLDRQRQAFQKDLDASSSSRSPFGQNQQKVNSAKRLMQLVAGGQNLDPRQMEELSLGLAALLSGSNAPAQSTIQNLVPHSAAGNAASLREWLMNEPRGTGQQAFVKRMVETIEREQKAAEGMIREAQLQRLGAHKALFEKDPEGARDILKRYGLADAVDENFQPRAAAPEAPTGPAVRKFTRDASGKIVEVTP